MVETRTALPNEDQKRALADMLAAVFIELRSVSHLPDQVHELAYTFHNLPKEMYGWGSWDVIALRSRLASYRERFPKGGPNYAAMLDGIFGGRDPHIFDDSTGSLEL